MMLCQCVARRCGACAGTGMIPIPTRRMISMPTRRSFDEWPSYTSARPDRRPCRFCAYGAVFCCDHTRQAVLVSDDLDGPELAHLERDWVKIGEPGEAIGLVRIQPVYVRSKVLLLLAVLHKGVPR